MPASCIICYLTETTIKIKNFCLCETDTFGKIIGTTDLPD